MQEKMKNKRMIKWAFYAARESSLSRSTHTPLLTALLAFLTQNTPITLTGRLKNNLETVCWGTGHLCLHSGQFNGIYYAATGGRYSNS